MLAEKVCNLGLYRLGEQATRPIAQDFSELILDVSWLNQLDDVIFGHGISLLRWRSGGVKHPHDMPPFRFPPSPTLGDSSRRRRKVKPLEPFENFWKSTERKALAWSRLRLILRIPQLCPAKALARS